MEALTGAAIATLVFTKFFETSAEKLTEGALEKLNRLREKIWNRFRGKSEVEKVLTDAENGSSEALKQVVGYLDEAMEKDPVFAKEVNDLAREIINIGKIEGESWIVTGGEVKYVKDNKAPVIQGEIKGNVTFIDKQY
ncbi:hypothetical protein [Spirulina sp. 06S082]|uniref:hypothetical protein n=1 Tax=Spirulina sp. 06S082 TaxID=3110248 RepID=UPI002B2160C0|nr:hypothetical protein [Spirulina sp. 06S082]MEA5468534.1 hypothetical protein [Spirulina sp. 06S082]